MDYYFQNSSPTPYPHLHLSMGAINQPRNTDNIFLILEFKDQNNIT